MNAITEALVSAQTETPDSKSQWRGGDLVRVRAWVFEDGQTPKKYKNEKLRIHRVESRGLLVKFWLYTVVHPDGSVCEFKGEELKA